MRTYDYTHSGITDGNAATPGRIYKVLRTSRPENRKLIGLDLLATKLTQEYEVGEFRLFVSPATGGFAWLDRSTVLS